MIPLITWGNPTPAQVSQSWVTEVSNISPIEFERLQDFCLQIQIFEREAVECRVNNGQVMRIAGKQRPVTIMTGSDNDNVMVLVIFGDRVLSNRRLAETNELLFFNDN